MKFLKAEKKMFTNTNSINLLKVGSVAPSSSVFKIKVKWHREWKNIIIYI